MLQALLDMVSHRTHFHSAGYPPCVGRATLANLGLKYVQPTVGKWFRRFQRLCPHLCTRNAGLGCLCKSCFKFGTSSCARHSQAAVRCVRCCSLRGCKLSGSLLHSIRLSYDASCRACLQKGRSKGWRTLADDPIKCRKVRLLNGHKFQFSGLAHQR